MATTSGPDLSPAVAAVERLMDDTCWLTRNQSGNSDAALNQATGALVEPDPQEVVYSGKCFFSLPSALGGGVQSRAEGGRAYVERLYVVSLPLSAPQILVGDVVTCTSARRDAQLAGQTFKVIDVLYKSFSISRKAVLEAREVTQ